MQNQQKLPHVLLRMQRPFFGPTKERLVRMVINVQKTDSSCLHVQELKKGQERIVFGACLYC